MTVGDGLFYSVLTLCVTYLLLRIGRALYE